VILADYSLPLFDALHALHLLQARNLDVPFIVVTGSIGEEAAVECMKRGAADYLLKDRLTRLGPAVTHALEQKRLRDEKRQAEEALRESEARYRQAVENSPNPIFSVNRAGVIQTWNEACARLFQYESEEIIGQSYHCLLWNPEEHLDIEACLAQVWQGQSLSSQDITYQSKDGTLRFMVSRLYPLRGHEGKVQGCVFANTDITERQRAEEEIKRLNQDLERRARGLAALHIAGQIMASTLDRDTLLQRIMEQVASLLEAEGASVLMRVPSAEGEGDELVFAAATGPGSSQLVARRLAGTSIASWVAKERQAVLINDAQSDSRLDHSVDDDTGMTTRSLLAVPLVSKGIVLGVVEAVNKMHDSEPDAFDKHDLEVMEALASSAAIAIENAQLYASEQQRAAALARALEKQRELERLQREFIQNVSHELRTPLALIRGHAEVLENGWLGALSLEQKESASVIVRRTQMLGKLVEDIMGILEVERQELRCEPVNPAQLVRTSLADFEPVAAQAGLSLAAELEPDVPGLSGDLMALRRMLDNLVGNALKFTPAGGCVTIRLSRSKEKVKLQVADTGIGIPSDQLDRIFERFYQVDGSMTRKYGGVGLGLALVKSIVEAHRGQINVASQVGVGTTFTIWLPIA
jgi:PAS domain S-box-containing protein